MTKINIDEIIKNIDKYHYYISSTNKTIFLSSSNNKEEARSIALKKLAPNIINLIGKNVILVTIRNIENKFKENIDFNTTGGPIVFELENEFIKSNTKISSGDKSKRNVYLSEKYIKKNKSNILVKLKDIVNDYKNNQLSCQQGILCMTIL